MSTVDLTTIDYPSYPSPVGAEISPQIISRRITGAELTAAGTPASDVFRIMKLRKGQLVREVKTIVHTVDIAGVTNLDIGYQDKTSGTGTADAFEGNASLAAKATIISADDSLVMWEDAFLTITPNSAITSTCVFIISALIEDYGLKLRDDTMTAVL